MKRDYSYNELKHNVITEYVIMCFASGCENEVRDTDGEKYVADLAKSEGFVVRGDETFCAEHADDDDE